MRRLHFRNTPELECTVFPVDACKLAPCGLLVELYHHVGALTEKKQANKRTDKSAHILLMAHMFVDTASHDRRQTYMS